MAKLKIDVHDLHKYYGENGLKRNLNKNSEDVVCIIRQSGSE